MNVVILMKPSPTHTLQAFVRYLGLKQIRRVVHNPPFLASIHVNQLNWLTTSQLLVSYILSCSAEGFLSSLD